MIAQFATPLTPVAGGIRQQVLCLWLANSDLGSPVVAWNLFDGAAPDGPRATEYDPPYANAVAAMRDGWRVMQMTMPQRSAVGEPLDVMYLEHAVVLERLVETKVETNRDRQS